MEEEHNWRGVPDFETIYMVSGQGHIRNRSTGKLLFGERDADGYRKVNLSKSGKATKRRVHRIVCEAFHGPCPDGHECGHLDGDPRNNRADNLRWISRSENVRHSIEHGTFRGITTANAAAIAQRDRRGHRNPGARFSTETIASIREGSAAGLSERALANKHGVAPSTIHRIVSGKSYNG